MTDSLVVSLYGSAESAAKPEARGGLRFAFWGRCSTEDMQEPESSRRWQLTLSEALIKPIGGEIVAEFFDIDESRSIPPQRRPRASELLDALGDPGRGWDAVVVGEPHRAFYGNQFGNTMPLFDHYGVQMWVPEIGGAINTANEAHEIIMNTYGGMSKGERNRDKIRVRAAMSDMARFEGRYLGGRPPYGYTLVDVGPHPNPRKAAEGRRLRALVPDTNTSGVVQRIFAEFIAGWGLLTIAEGLTRDGILCPSAYDPGRNSHRSGIAWAKSAIRAILLNPRYTGRQVWGRQRKDEVLIDVNDVTLGNTTKLRWNDPSAWVWSQPLAHPPIIDDETFTQAQTLIRTPTREVTPAPRRTRHSYQFRTLIWCGKCERRMQGSFNNGKAHYRCKFPKEYAQANSIEHPRTVYVREELIAPAIDDWLTSAFSAHNVEATVAALADAQTADTSQQAAVEAARTEIAEADTKLTRYREALEAGADAAVVSGWIADAQAKKLAAKRRLDAATPSEPTRMTREEIDALVKGLGDLLAVLRDADPADKNEIYLKLGLKLTYHPEENKMIAQANPNDHVPNCVRGGT